MSSDPTHRTRREALAGGLKLAAAGLGGGLAAACSTELPGAFTATTGAPGMIVGRGSVKVGLILPLGAGGQAGAAGASLKNAAELAITEFENPNVQLLVKDSGGTPEGARDAAEEAFAEGAEIVLGPLFAPAVLTAGEAARAAGRPLIAFSTDANVASRGVYLLSFMPQGEVARIVAYASAQGRRSFAALVPETPYGTVAEAAFLRTVAARGGRVVVVERYSGDGTAVEAAVERLVAAAVDADALFIPDAEVLPIVGESLAAADLGPKLKLIGTGVWNDPSLFALPALQGGWFAAPDSAGFNAFARRYREKFGAEPTRISTLAYDGASLVAALARTQGPQRFSEAVLTNPAGFNGADGVFRFRADGTNERGLAVLEVRNNAAVIVSPAPRTLAAPSSAT